MPQGIKLLKHQKYAKMLVNPPDVPFHTSFPIKKTTSLRFAWQW